MKLVMKQLVQVDITGKYLWTTCKTGAYDADSNEGGFGAPNPSLAHSALLVVAVRVASDEQLEFVNAQIKYNASVLDADEFQWQMVYPDKDGHIKVYMFRVWVSDDGLIDKSGDHAIVEGDFFFIPANSDSIWLKTGSGVDALEEIELADLIDSEDEENPYSVMCEDLFVNELAKQLNRLYREKRLARQREDTRQFEDLRDQITDLLQDIQGADYTFRGGLTTQANDIVESATDEYLNG